MSTPNRKLLPIAAALGLFVAACGRPQLTPSPPPVETEHPCPEVYPQARCEALLSAAVTDSGLEVNKVVELVIMPSPTIESQPGVIQHSGLSIAVRLEFADGSSEVVTIGCGGISPAFYPPCMSEPKVFTLSPTGVATGYRDPPRDSSPVPSRDPHAVAAARPIRIAVLAVAAGGPGHHEVEIGSGSLPNGILTDATFDLAEAWPKDVLFTPDGVHMIVRSKDRTRPRFDSLYEHGWFPGVEEVKAVLVFDVLRAEPGATFEVLNVVVD